MYSSFSDEASLPSLFKKKKRKKKTLLQRKSERSSHSVTLRFAPTAQRLLIPPPLLLLEAQTLLPVWLQRRQSRRGCPLPRLLSWQRRSVDVRWQVCWATAWHRCMTEEADKKVKRLLVRLYVSSFSVGDTYIFIIFETGRMENLSREKKQDRR